MRPLIGHETSATARTAPRAAHWREEGRWRRGRSGHSSDPIDPQQRRVVRERTDLADGRDGDDGEFILLGVEQ